MNEPIILLAIVIVMLLGIGLGWFLGGRGTTAALAERDLHLEKFRQAIADLATMEERARDVPALRESLAGLGAEAAGLRAALETRERGFQEQIKALVEAKESLSSQFTAVGAKILEDAQKQFLDRADARFKQSEETAGQGLKALLQPVTERLERYEKGVEKVEEARRDAFGELKGQIEQMRIGQEKVSSEAAKLVNSLRNAPKSRGRWGEQQLKNVLETCGLSEHADFQTEVSVEGEEGRLRPDAIVRVPGGRALVIDAKVSLNAYQDAFGAVEEAERNIGLGRHAAAMRAHVNALGNKAYWSQFADAPDYVIMFVPGEHFLSAALEHDSTLWDFAFEKRVLLATPTNLIAIARTVSAVWRQEKLAKEARQIGELGKELYDRLAKVGEDLGRVGSGLNSAVSHFNKATTSFNGRLVSTGRKFRDLNIETGARELDDVSPVETLARLGDAPALIEELRDEAAE